MVAMTTWDELTNQAPELAAAIERSFAGGKHKIMATLRRDGSPRVSGTEVSFFEGDVWLGSMPGAMKARDLLRDPRLAIHGPTVDETMALGDTKLGGRAAEITDPDVVARFLQQFKEETGQSPPEPFHLFRIELDEAVCTRVDGDHLVIDSWHQGRGVNRVERR
jgi:hypothetical protein